VLCSDTKKKEDDTLELLDKAIPMWTALVMTFGVIGGMSKRPKIQWFMAILNVGLCIRAIFSSDCKTARTAKRRPHGTVSAVDR